MLNRDQRFVEALPARLASGLRALLRRRQLAAAAETFTASIDHITITLRDQLTPALLSFSFAMQRMTVEWLLVSPWYRHLRLRWSLRRAPQWVATYPPLEVEPE